MQPGARRAQLDATLSAAYAEGLLSDDTFVARLQALAGRGALDPQEIVGDVTLARTGPTALVARLTHATRSLVTARTVPLLALDWDGALGTLLIGRGDDCDVVVDHPAVSRRHARLRFHDGGWVLRDLGSLNGTTINGAPAVRSRLAPGDLVAFAGERFRID